MRLAGRVETTPTGPEVFAQSLGADDQVVLEATANALAIARVVESHVARVVLARVKRRTARRAGNTEAVPRGLKRLLDDDLLPPAEG